MFFYEIGVLLKNRYLPDKYIIFLLFLVFILICLTGYPVLDMWKNDLHHGNYLVWYLYMGLISISLIRIGKCYNKPIPVINWIGNNAMIIFGTHWIVLSIIKTLGNL